MDLEQISVNDSPIEVLKVWLDAAAKIPGIREPSAMIVSSLTETGGPSGRVILIRGLDERGLVFFTNYESQKGRDFERQSLVAGTFYWDAWARQVRVEGRIQRTQRAESEEYWRGRPRDSQIGGWASAQSQTLSSREELIQKVQHYEEHFKNQEVPCPPHWGGYRIVPFSFEFWIGRENRLHDRYRFDLGLKSWELKRLSP